MYEQGSLNKEAVREQADSSASYTTLERKAAVAVTAGVATLGGALALIECGYVNPATIIATGVGSILFGSGIVAVHASAGNQTERATLDNRGDV